MDRDKSPSRDNSATFHAATHETHREDTDMTTDKGATIRSASEVFGFERGNVLDFGALIIAAAP